jgi:hypothetical protein
MEKQRFHKELAIFLAMVITRALSAIGQDRVVGANGTKRARAGLVDISSFSTEHRPQPPVTL